MAVKSTSAGDTIGRGLLFPLRRRGEDLESGTGEELLKSNVRKVISVDGATEDGDLLGEYPWRLEFGSQIARLRHTNIRDVREDMAIINVAQSVAKWEPRAVVLTDRSFVDLPSGQTGLPATPRTKRLVILFRQEDDAVGGDVRREDMRTEVEVAL